MTSFCFNYYLLNFFILKFALDIFSKIELFLAALFGFDWIIALFIADHKWLHFFRLVLFIGALFLFFCSYMLVL